METLEEAAERILLVEDLDLSDYDKRHILKAMLSIAKWQQEQAREMEKEQKGFSEEQVRQAITNFYMNDFLLTEEKLTKVINDLKQQEQ